MSRTLTEEDD